MKALLLFYCLVGLCRAQMTVEVIGNTGLPTTTTGHVPYLIPGICADQNGKVYTVHDWDEPHQDVKIWDPSTGQAVSNTGNLNTNELIDALCVEPDGSYVYATSWANKAPNIQLLIWKIDPVHKALVKFTSAGYFITVSNTSSATLLPIALGGSTIWVVDSTGNRVVGYDKNTGLQTVSIPFNGVLTVAVDTARNNIWLGTNTTLYVYSSTGQYLATGLQYLKQACSLYIQGRTIVVGDRGWDCVFLCTMSSTGLSASYTHTYTDGYSYIWDAVVDPSANFLVTDSVGPGGGSRMRKFDPNHNLIWTQTDTEFQSNIAYSPANPGTLVSMSQQTYSATRPANTTTWAGYGGSANSIRVGPIKMLNLGGTDFEFVGCQDPTLGRNLVIYRVEASPTLTQIEVLTPPQPVGPGTWTINSYSVDDNGAIWMANAYHHITTPPYSEKPCVWKVPLTGLDENANPVYDFTQAVEIVTDPQIRAALGVSTTVEVDNEMTCFEPADNLVYTLIYSPTTGVGRGAFWMAGNTLMAWNLNGTLSWKVNLPAASVGLSPVPTGGVLTTDNAGTNGNGVVRRYSNAGAVVTSYSPPASLGVPPQDNPTGAFDEFGALNCQLAPDGLLDIFAEDDFNGRVIWYHTP